MSVGLAACLAHRRVLDVYREPTRGQRTAVLAALGGWSLDAFAFRLKAIAGDFHRDGKFVAEGIFATLAFRPFGALFFGWLAEKYGSRPILRINVASFARVELASALAPSPAARLVLRSRMATTTPTC